MMNCRYCGFDYSEVGLSDGRCPQCSQVLAWEDGAAGEPDLTLHSSPPEDQGPSLPPLSISDIPPLDMDASLSSRPTPADLPPLEQPPLAPDYGTLPDKARDLSDSEVTRVKTIWESVQSANPNMTIKSDEGPASTSATKLVIQPRKLSDKHADTPLPDQPSFEDNRADYELLEVIGEGGVGVVYAARQASIDRTVALKMLRKENSEDLDQRNKFLSEAVVTGDLDHPNIVPIYDLGSNTQGALFYSMKRVRGTPWVDVMRNKSLAENLEILMKVSDAIAFAHARGVIHRDLKPENVMLGDFGEVLVMDWGIALSTALFVKQGSVTQSNSMGGTPAYMAPEMATGPIELIDTTSDVYLLGAILYEIITGKPPHDGPDVMTCLLAAARNEIQPTSKGGELLELARQAMATSQRDRYASVQDFQAAVREYQSHSESVHLSHNAEEQLAEAKEYPRDFAQAVYGFTQALELWVGNERAKDGLSRANLTYATKALEKGDFDLGLSLLNDDDPRHQPMIAELIKGRRERQAARGRVRLFQGVAALAVISLFVVGAIAGNEILKANRSLALETQKAIEQRDLADLEKKRAVASTLLVQKREKQLNVSLKQTDEARTEAVQQATAARESSNEARKATLNTVASSYRAEIGLVDKKIDELDYKEADRLLDLLGAANAPTGKMRHIEWGQLKYQASKQSMTVATDANPNSEGVALMAVAASSNGNHLVAAGGTVAYIWDRETRALLRTLDHGAPVRAVAFSRLGDLIATAGAADANGKTVKVWNLEDGAQLDSHAPHGAAAVNAVQFSKDAARLLTASDDKTASIAYRDGSPSTQFRGHLAAVRCAAFSPDERWVVTGSDDTSVRVWLASSGGEAQRFGDHTEPVFAAVFAPHTSPQRIASAGADRAIRTWVPQLERIEQEARQMARSTGSTWERQLAENFRAEVRQLVSLNLDPNAVRTSSYPTIQSQVRYEGGHEKSVLDLDYSSDGAMLISAGADNVIRVWDGYWKQDVQSNSPMRNRLLRLVTPEQRAEMPGLLRSITGHGAAVTAAAFIPDSNGQSIVSTSLDKTARFWQVEESSWRVTIVPNEPDERGALTAMDVVGSYMLAGQSDGTAHLYDHASREELAKLDEGHEFLATRAALYNARGRRFALTTAGDNTVRIWNAETGTQVDWVGGTGYRGVLSTSANDKYFITGSYPRKTAKIWRTDTLQIHQELLGKEYDEAQARLADLPADQRDARIPDVSAVAFSLDDEATYAFTGDTKGRGFVWKTADGSLVSRFKAHEYGIHVAVFAPDGTLFTGGGDGRVARWDPVTGQTVGARFNHPTDVTEMKLTSDGQYLFTVSRAVKKDKQTPPTLITRWAVDGSEPKREIPLEVERVSSLDFLRRDGKLRVMIACTTQGGDSVLRWDVDDADQAVEYWAEQPRRRGSIASASYAKGGEEVLLVGGRGARSWQEETGGYLRAYRPQNQITAVAFLPLGFHVVQNDAVDKIAYDAERRDQVMMVTASTDLSVKVWMYNVAEKKLRAMWRIELSDADRRVVNSVQCRLREDNRAEIMTAGDGKTVRLWTQGDDGKWTADSFPVKHGEAIRSARYSPDGKQVLSTAADGSVLLWTIADRDQPVVLKGHDASVLCGEFSSDGQWIITGDEQGTALGWFVGPGGMKAELHPVARVDNGRPINAVCLSRDRQRILTASEDDTLKIWDVRALEKRVAEEGHPSTWADRAEPLEELLTLKGHEGPVVYVGISPNGQDIYSASSDGRALVWQGEYVEPAVIVTPGAKQFPPRVNNEVRWEPIAVDELSTVREASKVDYENGKLIVSVFKLADIDNATEHLKVPSAEQMQQLGDDHLDVNGGQAIRMEGKDVFFNDVKIANLLSTRGSASLEFQFTAAVTWRGVEALLRSITYQLGEQQVITDSRAVTFYLTDGQQRSGNKSYEFKAIDIVVPEATSPRPSSGETLYLQRVAPDSIRELIQQ